MTDAATAVCPICKERFIRGRYGNRYGSGGRVETQRYCGKPRCRQRAYRVRRDIKNNTPASTRKRRGIGKVRLHSRSVTQRLAETPKGVGLPIVAGSVTQAKIHQQNQGPVPPQKTSPNTYCVVPDDIHPGMYRLRFPDGRLSDLVNRTRAYDALASFT